MDKVRAFIRATPFLGVGFAFGATVQLPLLLSTGAVRAAIIQGILLVLGTSWAIAGFLFRKERKRKIVKYLEAEGFDLSTVKGGRARTKMNHS